MKDKKVCFITLVNNEVAYQECLFYISNLNIPEGYDIEAIGIRNAYCIAGGYNKAIESTDAKYKIYLHQDTLIINRNFIYDIVNIFNNKMVGMIGVCGAKTVPSNGIWWDSDSKLGKVYDSHTGEMQLVEFNQIDSEYENVEAIDGLIMATQYDINWREDLFDGWHFYDLSQSMEFITSGYDVVVAKQNKPWCVHDSGIVNTLNGFDDYRKKYVKTYMNMNYTN